MAEQYNKKALMNAFGVEEDDPLNADTPLLMPGEPDQPIDPMPKVEMPGPTAEASPVAAAPDYRKTGKYASSAYDAAKLARPWEEQSEKYRIGNVLSNFDPSQGLTPEVIAALNAADIYGAKFSGFGDKLTVDNAGGWDRFGKGGTSDVNIGFKTGKGTWGAWTDPNLPQNQEGAGLGPMGGMNGLAGAQSNLNGLMKGDFQSAIQAALAKLTGDAPNLQALLAQLGGGQ